MPKAKRQRRKTALILASCGVIVCAIWLMAGGWRIVGIGWYVLLAETGEEGRKKACEELMVLAPRRGSNMLVRMMGTEQRESALEVVERALKREESVACALVQALVGQEEETVVVTLRMVRQITNESVALEPCLIALECHIETGGDKVIAACATLVSGMRRASPGIAKKLTTLVNEAQSPNTRLHCAIALANVCPTCLVDALRNDERSDWDFVVFADAILGTTDLARVSDYFTERLLRCLRSKDVKTRRGAAQLLGSFATSESPAGAVLDAKVREEEEDFSVRLHALNSLETLRVEGWDKTVMSEGLRFLSHADKVDNKVRVEAFGLLVGTAVPNGARRLLEEMEDSDDNVREFGFEVLSWICDEHGEIVPNLITLLDSEQGKLRSLIIQLLGKTLLEAEISEEIMERGIRALKRIQEDESERKADRESASESLAELEGK